MKSLIKRIWNVIFGVCGAFFAIFILIDFMYFCYPGQLGQAWAKIDLLRNHYEIRVYGLSYGDQDNRDYLNSMGISYVRVAGCVVNDPIIESTNSYNAVMKEAILEDLGLDLDAFLHDTDAFTEFNLSF